MKGDLSWDPGGSFGMQFRTQAREERWETEHEGAHRLDDNGTRAYGLEPVWTLLFITGQTRRMWTLVTSLDWAVRDLGAGYTSSSMVKGPRQSGPTQAGAAGTVECSEDSRNTCTKEKAAGYQRMASQEWAKAQDHSPTGQMGPRITILPGRLSWPNCFDASGTIGARRPSRWELVDSALETLDNLDTSSDGAGLVESRCRI
ncbi:hypothetical protein NDU88_001454 [Pleurodeles waltl]|uniref:Uncharacterized protein n=1 Tax=Pleurodeles waltl TaxID=8319 RepID=A0AAV7WKJ8_PLEWA|nr:hypothetical protein NDU88_001454 [Pleurodeles waltl]